MTIPTNIAAIVADLEKERSDIITAILDVTASSGSQARDKLLTSFDLLFVNFLGVHPEIRVMTGF